MKRPLKRLLTDVAGQDLIEYAFLVAFIALVVAGTLAITGTRLVTLFEAINARILQATP